MTPRRGESRRAVVLGATVLLAVVVTALVPRVPQDPRYHDFADKRSLGPVANAANVISNLAFLVAGLVGLVALRSRRTTSWPADPRVRWPYVVFFVGVVLTAAGSAYYHLAPSNTRLVWDRLPMTVAFTGLCAGVVGERISPRLGSALLPPLVAAGIASVWYWDLTEQAGAGDLRPYGLVQFGLMLLLVVVSWLWPARPGRGGLGLVLLVYAVSKGFELLDRTIWAADGIVSGHTLKHLTAALAAGLVVRTLTGATLAADGGSSKGYRADSGRGACGAIEIASDRAGQPHPSRAERGHRASWLHGATGDSRAGRPGDRVGERQPDSTPGCPC